MVLAAPATPGWISLYQHWNQSSPTDGWYWQEANGSQPLCDRNVDCPFNGAWAGDNNYGDVAENNEQNYAAIWNALIWGLADVYVGLGAIHSGLPIYPVCTFHRKLVHFLISWNLHLPISFTAPPPSPVLNTFAECEAAGGQIYNADCFIERFS